MKEFTYKITDEVGIHARPAGALVSLAKGFGEEILICRGDKCVDAKRLMAVMTMGIKKDDIVTVKISGDEEEMVCEKIKEFFNDNL